GICAQSMGKRVQVVLGVGLPGGEIGRCIGIAGGQQRARLSPWTINNERAFPFDLRTAADEYIIGLDGAFGVHLLGWTLPLALVNLCMNGPGRVDEAVDAGIRRADGLADRFRRARRDLCRAGDRAESERARDERRRGASSISSIGTRHAS